MNRYLKVLRIITTTALVVSVAFAASFVSPAASAKDASNKITTVQLDEGRIQGFVVDAETEGAIAGAKVELIPAPFDGKIKNTTGKTAKDGSYLIRAALGHQKSRISVGRLLTSSLGSILSGGAKKVKRHYEITQFNLNVSAPGYKNFQGVVPVKSFYTGGKQFLVDLYLIQLVKTSGKDVSHVDRSGKVLESWDAGTLTLSSKTIPKRGKVHLEWVAPSPKKGKRGKFSVVYHARYRGVDRAYNLNPKKNHLKGKDVFDGVYKIDKDYTKNGLYMLRVADDPWQYIAVGAPENIHQELVPLLDMLSRIENGQEPSLQGKSLRDQLEKKLSALEAIAKLWPQELEINEERVRVLSLLRRYEESLALLKVYPDALPSDISAFTGAIETEKGNYEAANKAFLEAYGDLGIGKGSRMPQAYAAQDVLEIKKDPANIAARRDLYFRVEGTNLEHYRKLIDVAVQNIPEADTPQQKIDLLYFLQEQGKAEEAYKLAKALKADSIEETDLQLQLAHYFSKTHHFDDAYDVYHPLFENKEAKKQWGVYAFRNYALALLARGDAAQGLSALNEALVLGRAKDENTAAPLAYWGSGGSLYSMATGHSYNDSIGYQYPEGASDALLYYNYPALQNTDKYWLSAASAAAVMAEDGLSKQALPILKKIADAHPDSNDVLLAYASGLFHSGDEAQGELVLGRALAINPYRTLVR